MFRSFSTHLKTLPDGKTFKALVLAAPGGHQSEISNKIAKTYKLEHISAKQKIYENIRNRTKLGKIFQMFKAKGMKICDEVMVMLINQEVEKLGCISWVISGFPQTVNQAQMFWQDHKFEMVLSVAFPQNYILMNLIQEYKNEQSEEAMAFTVGHVDKIINKHQALINPMLKFYDDVGVLHTFRENSLDGMWGKMKTTLKDRLVSKPSEP